MLKITFQTFLSISVSHFHSLVVYLLFSFSTSLTSARAAKYKYYVLINNFLWRTVLTRNLIVPELYNNEITDAFIGP